MYIYSLGYGTHEESDYHQLYHEEKYNDREFEDIIIQATINVLKRYEIKKDDRISFQDIIHSVTEELMKNFGFKEVKFTAKYSIFGWPNVLDEKDWKGQRDEELNRLTKKIKKEINFKEKNKY